MLRSYVRRDTNALLAEVVDGDAITLSCYASCETESDVQLLRLTRDTTSAGRQLLVSCQLSVLSRQHVAVTTQRHVISSRCARHVRRLMHQHATRQDAARRSEHLLRHGATVLQRRLFPWQHVDAAARATHGVRRIAVDHPLVDGAFTLHGRRRWRWLAHEHVVVGELGEWALVQRAGAGAGGGGAIGGAKTLKSCQHVLQKFISHVLQQN